MATSITLVVWSMWRLVEVKWLLNYRGGSFLLPYAEIIQRECQIRGVSFEVISDSKAAKILEDINKNFFIAKKPQKFLSEGF